ncbi:hypothetical protein M513_10022 [Trichuris suis]|uniref:Uncharacterized protein n=1 Tax=Trichuris suis TaxID=68888 RepID=A0A085LVT4_9BILA|nr:hypothetical protein M513_10022 [Trichuris suis]
MRQRERCGNLICVNVSRSQNLNVFLAEPFKDGSSNRVDVTTSDRSNNIIYLQATFFRKFKNLFSIVGMDSRMRLHQCNLFSFVCQGYNEYGQRVYRFFLTVEVEHHITPGHALRQLPLSDPVENTLSLRSSSHIRLHNEFCEIQAPDDHLFESHFRLTIPYAGDN